ncbi:MAG TPA: glycosyltransferase family 39 protein [Mycobacteriales bacterium]|nr:glycosyltransferase family 39 protein [Mycobacteriales bacterium]
MTVLDVRPDTTSSWRPPTARRPAPRVLRGRDGDPAWVRPGVLSLLAGTAVLYLWGLGSSGWANSFYSAAAQASTHSWKALFFGSLDSANSITVDKPPAALWVMDLSARLFGLSSWSILVPEALMGVATVGLIYLTVRRIFSPAAGLLAGAVMALTPVTTLMFRFNNPDALLVLLVVAAAYAVTRAVESAASGASTRWLLLAGLLVGTGFITKMMQAFLVVPAFGLAYLVAADTTLRRRIGQLLAAGAAMLVASGWWVAIVTLWPADARPYVGGSQDNSVLSLIVGYNGLGRLTGHEAGSVGIDGVGKPGLLRLFSTQFGGQCSWLLPAALLLLVATLWLSRHAPRTDPRRAQLVLWGGWLLVTGATFSMMSGITHPYYTVALAPATSVLVGIGATSLWARREERLARVVLAGAVALTAWWSVQLLDRTPGWQLWLRLLVLFAGGAAVVGIATTPLHRRRRESLIAAAALVASLAGPAAYSVVTATRPHTGSLPMAGPVITPARTLDADAATHRNGGLLDAPTVPHALATVLAAGAAGYRWVAATVGSEDAAGYQLASRRPVMSIGGYNGTDPSPTSARFESLVAQGQVHYFIPGGAGLSGDGSNTGTTPAAQITAWVEANFRPATVDGTTLYDLSTN